MAYSIPAMILVMGLRVAVSAMMTHPGEGLSGMTLFRAVNGFPLVFVLFEYILAVICFVYLYRIAETTVWLDVAGTMFLCYMFTEMLARIVEWIDYRLDPNGMAGAGVIAVAEIPPVFIILGVVFLINGMSVIYAGMRKNSEKETESCKKIKVIWIAGALLLIAAEIIPQVTILIAENDDASMIRYISLGFSVLFLASAVPFVLRLQKFCYEFYMYCYNRRR